MQTGIIFLAPKVDVKCIDDAIPVCSENCTQHVYDTSVFTNTIQKQWDLVCNREYLTNLSQTIFMLGILVGNMFFGGLADKLGRR